MSDDGDLYWHQLIGQVNVSLTGASDVELKVQLFDVLQQFFDGSNCWQESIGITVIPDTLDYSITPVQGGRILRLLGVLNELSVSQPAVMPEVGTVRFMYPYNDVLQVTAVVVKTVTDPLKCTPPDVPEWLLPAFYIPLMHGLLGNMMLQPGFSYSNPQLAQFHLVKFKDGIAHARVAKMRANTIGAQTWVFPQQFRVTSQRGGVSTFNVHPTPR